MTELFPFVLVLHLLGAIAGIGPTFAFAHISALGRTSPVHATFAVSVVRSIQTRFTVPLATLTLATGVALLIILRYDVLQTRWLLLSIVLFVSSLLWALLVQNRDLLRVIEVASSGRSPTPEESADLQRRRRRIRYGGLYMRAAAIAILFLMVLKPF